MMFDVIGQIKQLIRERDEARRKAQADAITASEFRRRSEEAERKIRELESRKPERVEVEVAPEDYKKVMAERHEMEGRVIKAEEAVQNMILERNEALTQMAREIASAEEERDDALERLAEERMNGGYQDPMDVGPFCDACAALLNRLYAAPHAKAMLMTKNEVELKRYENNVRMIMEWAVKTQDVIDAVQMEKFGEECVFSVL